MKINLTFSETFDIWYSNYANNKQGKDLLRAEGIHPDQLDVGNMSHKYFTQETCDMSVDANANSNEEHSYNNYYAEITKGLHKIEGYYLLFRYAEKRFGTDYAMDLMDSIVQGDLYFHDPTKIQVPYCYAYSTQFIMLYGRPYGQLYSVPPKRSDSFMAEVTETTMDLSQEFAGAIAMGDLIVNLCYYLKKEGYGVLEDGAYKFNLVEQSYIKNLFQKFIHVMNNKFRLSGESPFTNISIFDRGKLGTLFDGYHYTDGSTVDYDYVLAVQELFMDLFHLGDPTTGLPYRFPVVTINFDVEKDEEGNLVPVDKEFAMKAAHYNRPKGAFNIYPTSGTKVASCPLAPDTEVIIKDATGRVKCTTIDMLCVGRNYEVFHKGEFKKGKFIKTKTDNLYEIVLDNGLKIRTSPNHLNITQRGTVSTEDLMVGDLIPINNTSYDGRGEAHNDLGYIVGAFAGDGYINKNDDTTVFILGTERKQDVIERLTQICEDNDFDYRINESSKDSTTRFTITNPCVAYLVKEYVLGDNALEKHLNINHLLTKSMKFRLDFIEGYLKTDGKRGKNVIYTSSERMIEDMHILCNICGIPMRSRAYERTNNNLGCNNGNNLVYEMTLYKETYPVNGNSKLKLRDNTPYFTVLEVNKLQNKSNRPLNVFCFEMEDANEPYFTLANGIITHNCRLSNDFDRMKARQDSFGNGGLNIGSHRVVTVNLPRVALDTQETINYDFSNAEEKFFTILEKRLDQAKDLLLVHREEILRRRIEKGFLKFFDPKQVGWFNLEGMFSTFGITGVYEMCQYMGYEITSKEGENFVSKVLTFIEDYADKVSKETGHSFNVEEIPAENTGTKLAYKDNLLYGTDCKLYSNQFVPLMANVPVMDRLELEGKFMSKLSGGAITHINVLSEIDTDEKMYKLMLAAMSKGVEHFACNYGFNECEEGHVSIGGNQLEYCPICNKPIKDHITRVVGFFTRVSKWSAVRKEEFTKRTFKNV